MDWRTPSLSLVHHFIHSLVLMYKFLIYFKNLIIKPVVFDFSTSESHKRYLGQCSSITAIKADSISHGQIALTPKVIVSLTQSQQLFLSFLVFFFVVNCRFGSIILSRVMLPWTANFCKQRNSQQLFCLFYSLSFSLRRLFSSKVNDCPGFLTPHLLLLPPTADLTLYFDQTAPIPPQPTLNDHQPLFPLNFGNFD